MDADDSLEAATPADKTDSVSMNTALKRVMTAHDLVVSRYESGKSTDVEFKLVIAAHG